MAQLGHAAVVAARPSLGAERKTNVNWFTIALILYVPVRQIQNCGNEWPT